MGTATWPNTGKRSRLLAGPRSCWCSWTSYDALVTALEHIDGGRLIQQLQRLMRDGLAAGIRVVVTGDRLLLTGRLAALAENKIVLRMADRADYAVVGLHSRAVPADMPNGRGFTLPGGDLLQIAMLTEQGQGTAENQALRRAGHAGRPFGPAAVPGGRAARSHLGGAGAGPARRG